jgi:hypothetical protein
MNTAMTSLPISQCDNTQHDAEVQFAVLCLSDITQFLLDPLNKENFTMQLLILNNL